MALGSQSSNGKKAKRVNKKHWKRTYGSSMTAAGPCKVTKADGTVEILAPRKEKTVAKVPKKKS